MDLVIGNKNYSSWSLRPWLLLSVMGIPFDETKIWLFKNESKAELLKHSPAGKVPVLIFEGNKVWDSLAICETVAELYPEKHCWPEDSVKRALARTASSEMHSGFIALRNQLPMNCRKHIKVEKIDADLQADINRVIEIWSNCRSVNHQNGDYLYGSFSIADAMFAPVVIRLDRYGISVPDVVRKYMNSILEIPAMKQWIQDSREEKEVIEAEEI